MTQTLTIICAFIMSGAVALNFGLWMNNVHAGIFTFLVTFIAYTFKYDDN